MNQFMANLYYVKKDDTKSHLLRIKACLSTSKCGKLSLKHL